ncbi:MAG: phosphate ABC transporter permease subunit PstC [Verrucomicrobia bacterium]|nr:phosphate ABC transporter permease subunit PstC [Verrucomicrobiota bacterium]
MSEQDPKSRAIAEIRLGPDLFHLLCWVASAAAVATLGLIIYEIVSGAWPAMQKFGLGFLTSSSWVPNRENFGIFPFIIGTAASSFIAILFALPLGLAIAIFLSENFLPLPVRQVVRFVVEMLAAIPSVVYGLWGIFVVIPLMKIFGAWAVSTFHGVPVLETLFAPPAYGNSMLTASIVLALMILPTLTAISRNSLTAVPGTLREGAYALGATRWEAILGVILPTAAPGVVAATILALGRAMGETMAVAMLIGNSSRLSWSLLSPGGTLAGLLANQFGEAEGMQVNSLMFAALILVVITLFVNLLGEAVLRYTQNQTAGIR